jgi:hypothetical protein
VTGSCFTRVDGATLVYCRYLLTWDPGDVQMVMLLPAGMVFGVGLDSRA